MLQKSPGPSIPSSLRILAAVVVLTPGAALGSCSGRTPRYRVITVSSPNSVAIFSRASLAEADSSSRCPTVSSKARLLALVFSRATRILCIIGSLSRGTAPPVSTASRTAGAGAACDGMRSSAAMFRAGLGRIPVSPAISSISACRSRSAPASAGASWVMPAALPGRTRPGRPTNPAPGASIPPATSAPMRTGVGAPSSSASVPAPTAPASPARNNGGAAMAVAAPTGLVPNRRLSASDGPTAGISSMGSNVCSGMTD